MDQPGHESNPQVLFSKNRLASFKKNDEAYQNEESSYQNEESSSHNDKRISIVKKVARNISRKDCKTSGSLFHSFTVKRKHSRRKFH